MLFIRNNIDIICAVYTSCIDIIWGKIYNAEAWKLIFSFLLLASGLKKSCQNSLLPKSLCFQTTYSALNGSSWSFVEPNTGVTLDALWMQAGKF